MTLRAGVAVAALVVASFGVGYVVGEDGGDRGGDRGEGDPPASGIGAPSRVLAADGTELGTLRAERYGAWSPAFDPVLDRVFVELFDGTPWQPPILPTGRGSVLDGGLVITTTIEPAVQDAADALTAASEAPMSIVVMDHRRHAITGIVGPSTAVRRSPGSAFTTFTAAAALYADVTLDTVLPAGEATFQIDDRSWKVTDFDRAVTETTLRDALVETRFVPFAALVADGRVPVASVIDVAHEMGVSLPSEPLPSVAVGAVEVTPFDLLTGYATLANGGLRPDAHVVSRVTSADGEVLWGEPDQRTNPGFDGFQSRFLREALVVDVDGTTPAFGKDGATVMGTDAWFAGATPAVTAVVHVGSLDGRSTTGITPEAAATAWRDLVVAIPNATGPNTGPFPGP